MYYSEDIIEEVRTRNDIVDVISSYVKLTRKGSSYFGLCPFHNEKSPSFSVSPQKQMYYCFGCGEGGNVISFMMKYENYTFKEALAQLADRGGVSLPEAEYTEEERKKADLKSVLLDINKEAALYFYRLLKSEKGERALAYLRERGLSDDTVRHFGLGYSANYKDDLYRYMREKGYNDEVLKETGLFTYSERGVYDKFNNRVMFPIMDINSRVIGFGGRVMGQGEPKYLNSPETLIFDKGRNLYGMNIARSALSGAGHRDSLLICEGYMDVIALHQAGFSNAVASLGTALTGRQASLIKRYTDNVYLTYDSDGAGVKAALRAIPIFREAGLTVKVINMRPHKDPDEFIKSLGAKEYEERIKNARNSFMYEIDRLKDDADMDSPEGKAAFQMETARKLLVFQDELERNVYMEAVSNEFFIPKDALVQSVKKQALTYTGDGMKSRTVFAEGRKENAVGKKEDDGIKRAWRILLTWLIEEPEIYEKIKDIISPADFLEPLYNRVAELVFEQLKDGTVNPARVLNSFSEEEEHREASALFNTSLSESLSGQEREKALNETVIKVKKNSLLKSADRITDIKEMQENIREQKALERLKIYL